MAQKLNEYHEHLQERVERRTAELTTTNAQLHRKTLSVHERRMRCDIPKTQPGSPTACRGRSRASEAAIRAKNTFFQKQPQTNLCGMTIHAPAKFHAPEQVAPNRTELNVILGLYGPMVAKKPGSMKPRRTWTRAQSTTTPRTATREETEVINPH